MRDDHVAVGPGSLVEAGARADRERLRHVDLHVVDVKAVPDRLEQAVREAQREDVLRGLLAEEVVDAEHLLLREHLVHLGVERAGAREVGPERLLHDHPRVLHQAGVAEQADRLAGGGRRNAQVMQQPRAVAA